MMRHSSKQLVLQEDYTINLDFKIDVYDDLMKDNMETYNPRLIEYRKKFTKRALYQQYLTEAFLHETSLRLQQFYKEAQKQKNRFPIYTQNSTPASFLITSIYEYDCSILYIVRQVQEIPKTNDQQKSQPQQQPQPDHQKYLREKELLTSKFNWCLVQSEPTIENQQIGAYFDRSLALPTGFIFTKRNEVQSQNKEKYQNQEYYIIQQQTEDYWMPLFGWGTYVYVHSLCNLPNIANEFNISDEFYQIQSNQNIINLIENPQKIPRFSDTESAINEQFLEDATKIIQKTELNYHQKLALKDALNFNKIVTIIEGPPGTGKTLVQINITTILLKLMKERGLLQKRDQKILMTSHTNLVVNDILRKLKGKVEEYDLNGINILRIGSLDKIEKDILLYSLEYQTQVSFFQYCSERNQQLEEEINWFQDYSNLEEDFNIQSLKQKLEEVKEIIKEREENNLQRKETIEHEKNYQRMFSLLQDADFLLTSDQLKDVLYEFKTEYIKSAHVLVCTNNSCHQIIQPIQLERVQFQLEMVLSDQAPQSFEFSTLIAMAIPTRKIVLIGDPKQLGPTVIDFKQSKRTGYNITLYERLLDNGLKSIFLNHQHRSVPFITSMISKFFYQDQLHSSGTVEHPQQYNQYVESEKNYILFDIEESKMGKKSNTHSYQNIQEAKAVVSLIKYLLPLLKETEPQSNLLIAILTPYKAQRELLKVHLEAENIKLKQYYGLVQVHTVDTFQGQEADIVIVSLVRTLIDDIGDSNPEPGFLGDRRRLNVMLSRAQFCQFIFSQKKYLENLNHQSNQIFSDLIEKLEDHEYIVQYKTNMTNLQKQNFFNQQLTCQNE